MAVGRVFVLGVVVLLSVFSRGHGYFVTVDAHSKECFFDRVTSGMKLGLTFEVVEGGFLDIDVEVRSFYLAQDGSKFSFLSDHRS